MPPAKHFLSSGQNPDTVISPFQTRWAAPPLRPLECEAWPPVRAEFRLWERPAAPPYVLPSPLLTTCAHTHTCSHGSHVHTQNTLTGTGRHTPVRGHSCAPRHTCSQDAHALAALLPSLSIISQRFLSVVLPAQHPCDPPVPGILSQDAEGST